MLSFAKKNHQKFIPRHPSQEDIYLVSFPKSGNTWLRFLLATAIKLHYDIKREVNFFSIHDIIPDVWISRDIRCQGIFGESALPRILKSHSSHNPYYHRVLLLVRDPRDTLISYYYYLSNYGKVDLDKLPFSEFIKDNKYGVQAWLKHTDSWLKVNRPAQIIRVFRYEDLLQDPEKQLYLMLDLIGIPVDFDKIKLAIELCSKERMKQSELKHMSNQWLASKKTDFVRKAKADGGTEISLEVREQIETLTRDIARGLGYDY